MTKPAPKSSFVEADRLRKRLDITVDPDVREGLTEIADDVGIPKSRVIDALVRHGRSLSRTKLRELIREFC